VYDAASQQQGPASFQPACGELTRRCDGASKASQQQTCLHWETRWRRIHGAGPTTTGDVGQCGSRQQLNQLLNQLTSAELLNSKSHWVSMS